MTTSLDADRPDVRAKLNGDVRSPTEITEVIRSPRPLEPLTQTFPERLGAKLGERCEMLPHVAGYEIFAELGRGGMGVVYKARQCGLNRLVALKMVLGGTFASAECHARFRSEAEAIARMQHPNIVQVFASGIQESAPGEASSCPFFAQEYVDGGNLSQQLAGRPQPPRPAAHFVATLARAVHYAHENGIIHRDLKPANILLAGVCRPPSVPRNTETGNSSLSPDHWLMTVVPKISDFGLAKSLDGERNVATVLGTVVGTPEYMAPEQAAGETAIGPAADTYALGAILYELLTGRPPFEVSSPRDTADRVCRLDPVPPRRSQPRTPRDLETICLKCLQKSPAERYATAWDLAEDLQRFLQGVPIQARPVGLGERLWRWTRRHPAVAALSGLVLVLAIAGLCGVTLAWLHALAGWSAADALREQALGKQREAEQRREEADTSVYFSRIAQARLESRLNNQRSAVDLLNLCIPRGSDATDRRGWEWHFLKGTLHADLLTIPLDPEPYIYDLTFSPDGERLMTAAGDPFAASRSGSVQTWGVWEAAAGQAHLKLPQPSLVRKVVASKDGRQIVWSRADGQISVADAATGAIAFTRTVPADFANACLSPDGSRYASCDRSGQVQVWDLASGESILSLPGYQPGFYTLAFGRDGGRLAVCGDRRVLLYDVATGRELGVLASPPGGRPWPSFSSDGRLLALGTSGGLVRIWDIEAGQMIQNLTGHVGGVLALTFSPDSRFLASAGADQTVRLWDVKHGTEERLFRGHQGRAVALCFHPSGRYLASGSQQPAEVKMWDLTHNQEYVTVAKPFNGAGRIEAIGFRDQGQSLQALRFSGWLQVSDVGTEIDQTTGRVEITRKWLVPAALAAFRPDGQRLAFVSKADTRIVTVVDPTEPTVVQKLTHAHEVLHVGFSGDGRRLVTSAVAWKGGDGSREVVVWDPATGERLRTVSCEPFVNRHIYGAVALSPAGDLLASDEFTRQEPGPADDFHGRVVVRDVASGQTLHALEGFTSLVRSLAFSPDGRLLAIALEDQGVLLYDCGAGCWLHSQALDGSLKETMYDLVFSPDGRCLAGVDREQVHVWAVATGQMIFALRGAPPRSSDGGFNPRIAWSPDGQRLAASNWNHTVSIWDAADRESPAAKRRLHRSAKLRGGRP